MKKLFMIAVSAMIALSSFAADREGDECESQDFCPQILFQILQKESSRTKIADDFHTFTEARKATSYVFKNK